MRNKSMRCVYVWTWVCDFGKGPELCRFAQATKKQLIDGQKPTEDAKPVRVLMGSPSAMYDKARTHTD